MLREISIVFLSEAKDLLLLRPAEDPPLTIVILSEAKDLLFMRADHTYFVYILASRSRNLYIGVTSSLIRRIKEHKQGSHDSHTARYKIDRLVYFERFTYINNAIAREKQLKGRLRARKLALISGANPTWEDLSLTFNRPIPPPTP